MWEDNLIGAGMDLTVERNSVPALSPGVRNNADI